MDRRISVLNMHFCMTLKGLSLSVLLRTIFECMRLLMFWDCYKAPLVKNVSKMTSCMLYTDKAWTCYEHLRGVGSHCSLGNPNADGIRIRDTSSVSYFLFDV